MRLRTSRSGGYSFVELLVVATILLVLASAVLPVTKVVVQRQREVELRRALREIRTAIDQYKDAIDLGTIGDTSTEVGDQGYPPNLMTLVNGVERVGGTDGERLRFLRKIPVDPIARGENWGLRAYDDPPGARSWGGGNVYDVFSTSRDVALDGTRYRDW